MNKTVNINLAGIFFHIDEDAYLKLQRYLEAIKRSFTNSQGREEIIADIEARIAELFNERVQNDKQVIRLKEVDEVISIMGQPEDYLIDEEIFEDAPQNAYKGKTKPSKKLFRDTDNSYIGGVSSGLAHYFGIDAVWVRLAWILLIFGAGTGFLLYILLWILIPEAKTTAEKLMMTGEPVNISNIEKKIKDGFDSVTETMSDVAKNVSDSVSNAAKKVDVKKGANSIKSTSRSFFDALANVIMFFLKIFAKIIGLFLIFVGAFTIIGLFIGLFSLSFVNIVHIPGLDLVDMANTANTPIWLVSLCTFFAVGIPFFFLFYLGLKILVNNLKSIGNIAKFTLLGLWGISIIALIIMGIRQASEHAFQEHFVEKTQLPITASDTLKVKMLSHDSFNPHSFKHNDNFKLAYDENGNKQLFSANVTILVKPKTDSLATVSVGKKADGRDYETAFTRAKHIDYGFELNNNTLALNSYLTTNPKNKYSEQKVVVTLYLPINTVVYFNNSTKYFLHYSKYNGNIILREHTNHYLKITEDNSVCLDCPDEKKSKKPKVKINNNSIEITSDDTHITIDRNKINTKSDEVKLNIHSEDVKIESD